jgi:hypothetical protein
VSTENVCKICHQEFPSSLELYEKHIPKCVEANRPIKRGTTVCKHATPTDARCDWCEDELEFSVGAQIGD